MQPGWPAITASEYRADRIVHAVGLLVAPVAVAALVVGVVLARSGPLVVVGVAVYGSALYNLLRSSPWRDWLRRCDHAAIFAMIAGTYTPFTLLWLPPGWGWAFCLSVWAVAGVGIAIKFAWPRRLERLSIVLYLALGWSILPAIEPMTATMAPAGLLLLAGGGLYSVGVVFHLWSRLPYQNAIWHGFVLAAAACHFAAIALGVAGPTAVPFG